MAYQMVEAHRITELNNEMLEYQNRIKLIKTQLEVIEEETKTQTEHESEIQFEINAIEKIPIINITEDWMSSFLYHC